MDKPYEGVVSRYLNRRLSVPLAKVLARTSATPNQISLLSFLMAVGAGTLYALGENILAGVLVQASSVMDGVDGDLARLKNMTSRFGGFFDAVLDRYADVAILAGVLFWTVDRQELIHAEVLWLMGILAIAGSLIVSYSRARAEADFGAPFHGVVGILAARDARLLLVAVGSVLGQGLLVLAAVAVMTNSTVVARLVVARRMDG